MLKGENNKTLKSKNNKKRQGRKKEYGLKPNSLIYLLVELLLNVFVKPYFKVTWNVNPKIMDLKPPFIVLGNHPSYLDPFLVGLALHPFRINFLASSTFFRKRILNFLLRHGGVIPKKQFRADPVALKSMISVIKSGHVLGIFPEGTRTVDGSSMQVEDSITKFIKKMQVPVILCKTSGAYLTWPRWSLSGLRRGRIVIDANILFSSEDIMNSDHEELHQKTIAAFSYNEYEWQNRHNILYKSKSPASGLHNILHKCPKCQKDWIMTSFSNKLVCRFCENTAIMDLYGFLSPSKEDSVIFRTVKEWNDFQKLDISNQLLSNGYQISDEAQMLISENDGPLIESGNGNISLSNSGFKFDGVYNTEKFQKIFPIAGILGIISDYGINFEIVSDNLVYHFVLKNGQKAITFSHALDAIRKSHKA